jgi:hypothetical protein
MPEPVTRDDLRAVRRSALRCRWCLVAALRADGWAWRRIARFYWLTLRLPSRYPLDGNGAGR